MNAQKYLLDRNCGDLILNDKYGTEPQDRLYASDLMESYHQAKSKEEAEERLVDYVDYMIELTEYIKLIGAELDETSVLAYTHGWRSDRVELGKEMRAELNKKAKELLLPEPFEEEES